MTKRVANRKRNKEEKSQFAFIHDVEEDTSLSTEEKVKVILETLTKMKIEIDQTKEYPDWIKRSKTKQLLSVLNIEPGDFLFVDPEDNEQYQFRQILFQLLNMYSQDLLLDMHTLIEKNWDLCSRYKFPNRRNVFSLIVAIHELVHNKSQGNGEIILTGLYNSVFHQIFRMNGYNVKGDVLREIRFDQNQPEFHVKCDSYTFSGNNILSIREDKDSTESEWENTDAYKSIIVSRALLRENLRSFKMNADDIKKYSKFLAITTNVNVVNCLLLECFFDENWRPSYHLSHFSGSVDSSYDEILLVVEFVCRYVRDYMIKIFKRVRPENSVVIGGTLFKNSVSQIKHVSTILRSSQHKQPLMLNEKFITETVQENNVWVVKSASVLKKVDEFERYIYAQLLSLQFYSPYLPAVLEYGHEYMELERLNQIEYEHNWDEDELIVLLFDMSCALKYLHSYNIIHRDVKPNNILLRTGKGDFFRYVLIDFNLSCHFERRENGLFNLKTKSIINNNCGTSIFKAPEVAKQENYSEKIDIFSLGMTIMYLFDIEKMEKEFTNNRNCNWHDILEDLPMKNTLKSIIGLMIKDDVTQRPSAAEVEKMFDDLKSTTMEVN